MTDEHETLEINLGSHFGYLSVTVSGLFEPSHSIATMIPRNIHLHKIFSHCRPVRDFAILLSTTSVAPTVENRMLLLCMIFEMALQ